VCFDTAGNATNLKTRMKIHVTSLDYKSRDQS